MKKLKLKSNGVGTFQIDLKEGGCICRFNGAIINANITYPDKPFGAMRKATVNKDIIIELRVDPNSLATKYSDNGKFDEHKGPAQKLLDKIKRRLSNE